MHIMHSLCINLFSLFDVMRARERLRSFVACLTLFLSLSLNTTQFGMLRGFGLNSIASTIRYWAWMQKLYILVREYRKNKSMSTGPECEIGKATRLAVTKIVTFYYTYCSLFANIVKNGITIIFRDKRILVLFAKQIPTNKMHEKHTEW